jgi:hypothetical protein
VFFFNFKDNLGTKNKSSGKINNFLKINILCV